MTSSPFIALLSVLVFAMPAFADADLEARVDAYLGSLDAPVTAAQWRALGPEAVTLLERHAFTSTALPTVRARAAEALGVIGSAEDGDRLLSLAAESTAPLIVRLSALRGAGRLLPADRLGPALSPLLSKDPNPRVRATSADVLAERLGTSGCELVQRQVKTEAASGQRAFAAALKRCSR